ncbi:hypothetical protein ACVXZ4_08295 [Lacisediminihabitans sp. FW035]
MKLNPHAIPTLTATVGAIALLWVSTAIAITSIVISGIALSTAATMAEGMQTSHQRLAASAVVPGVWPAHDYTVSWDQHVPPISQILFMFGSQKAADKAGAIASSSAWNPTADQRQPVLIAWKACQLDGHGRFYISKQWNGQITAGDCQAWWSGSDQRLDVFR